MRIVVAITGASGTAYGVRFVERAAAAGASIDLIVSAAGARVAQDELGFDLDPTRGEFAQRLGEHASCVRRVPLHDIGAECASGSVPFHGMAIVPCSMGTLGRVAAGLASNLIERAADVQLKERRPLVIVPRETPLNRIHLENLLRVHDAGAVVLPAMPAFYTGATTVAELIDTVVDRALAPFFGPDAIRSRWVPPRRAGGDS
ncbi:MAG: UbiX family flavin prenyltransferase [Planctomycetes bacterium]|nr:UbiX family flavin prenyltransferase [Planctomycetota bacterium]MCC7170182.1 UbiX family flavin prenyltransferase [Planctomycetota bacterium]